MARPGDGGSEVPPSLRVYLTGFGPFWNVSDNPSAALVQQLAAALNSKLASSTTGELPRDPGGSPASGPHDAPVGVTPAECPAVIELCGWEVLEVSAEAVTAAVPRIHSALGNKDEQARSYLSSFEAKELADVPGTHEETEEGPTHSAEDTTTEPLALALHFGVSMQSQTWRLEKFAKNDARFPCTDSRGCRPSSEVILSSMPLEAYLRSSLCLEPVAADLRNLGFPCSVSDDAGCFVCNFLYFKSLYEGQTSGVASLFVHVPPFSAMSLQQQLAAALRLLALLGRKEHQRRQGVGKPEETFRKGAQ